MNSEINPMNIYTFNEVADINPSRTVKKGTVTKYLSMDSVEPRHKHVSKIEYRKYNGGSKFKKNDILFARITPSLEHGKTCIVDFLEEGEIGAGSTEFIVISSKDGLTIPDYLYYLTTSNLVREPAIKSMTGTSGRQRVDTSVFDSIIVPIPPLNEQKAITKILSDLDSKIELNQKMNKILEAIAQAIFKHWFIDFEFPNEEGKPYKSSGGEMVDSELGEIPKGWNVEPLGSVLSLLKDGTHLPPKRVDKGFKFIAGATDVKHFFVDFSKCTYITKEEYQKIHKKWTLRPDDILLTIVGTLGNVAIVRERDLPFSMQRSIALLRVSEKIPYSYLYFLLNSDFFKGELQKRINPTAQPGIYLTELSKIKIIVPNKRIADLFHSVAQSFIKFMQSRIDNSDILTDLRDSLLPKLISGKVRVPLEE